MVEEFWLKYGFKDNGELICTRALSNVKPDSKFFYTDEEGYKLVNNSGVIRLTPEIIKRLNED